VHVIANALDLGQFLELVLLVVQLESFDVKFDVLEHAGVLLLVA